MASMITGDFVEAYVRKNACKEELRKAKASTAGGVTAAAQGEKNAGGSASSEKKEAKVAAAGSNNKGEGGSSLFGLVKKKVHPKVGGSAGASS